MKKQLFIALIALMGAYELFGMDEWKKEVLSEEEILIKYLDDACDFSKDVSAYNAEIYYPILASVIKLQDNYPDKNKSCFSKLRHFFLISTAIDTINADKKKLQTNQGNEKYNEALFGLYVNRALIPLQVNNYNDANNVKKSPLYDRISAEIAILERRDDFAIKAFKRSCNYKVRSQDE